MQGSKTIKNVMGSLALVGILFIGSLNTRADDGEIEVVLSSSDGTPIVYTAFKEAALAAFSITPGTPHGCVLNSSNDHMKCYHTVKTKQDAATVRGSLLALAMTNNIPDAHVDIDGIG